VFLIEGIKHGEPQGSVFGQILFLLYTNDRPISIQRAETVLFTNDTNILIEAVNEDVRNQKKNGIVKELPILVSC
jgi:hypothetical protein